MRPLQKKAISREQDRALAERSLRWTRLGTIFAALAIVVAIVIGAITITSSGSATQQSDPVGVAVNTVPHERIGGAPVYPVPGGEPSDYLSAGVPLYIDCLQPVKPDHLLARISYGPYKNHWIDVFDIKTPDGTDVRYLGRPLPLCGPAKSLTTGGSTG